MVSARKEPFQGALSHLPHWFQDFYMGSLWVKHTSSIKRLMDALRILDDVYKLFKAKHPLVRDR